MALSTLDLVIIFSFFAIILTIGVVVSKRSAENSSEYFLSGRNMPWWLLGMSMVATTFSTDTPNLVTDLVRQNGVAGNWVWWAFLLTGMLTVFVYAKLWRRSNLTTDIAFYELRYGGKPARFLRGLRAIYLGFFFNVLSISAVSLAAIKIGGIMLGISPLTTIGIASLITVIFSAVGGFKGVIYTDFLLFFVAMAGSISAAYFAVNHEAVGGLTTLFANENVTAKMDFFPDFSNKSVLINILIIPLAVQWWSAWYPGSEPGGGGYIAQRMLASKNENHAIGATFFFNLLHYALRPWPWILVALASLVVFPDLASIQAAFPGLTNDKLGHDLAYPAMLTFLPTGFLGLVLASLAAAFMSTISTHLNWGSSYLVTDFYQRFVKPTASEKNLVAVGRITTVLIMVFGALMALSLTNASQIFNIIIMFGAGTGLIFILRWFWWRINAWSEISAMFFSGLVSILFNLTPLGNILFGYVSSEGTFIAGYFDDWMKFPLVVLLTTIVWVSVTFLTKPETDETLMGFYKKTTPGGNGWKRITDKFSSEEKMPSINKSLPMGIIAMLLGCAMVYSALFATGSWIYGCTAQALPLTIFALVTAYLLKKTWEKLKKS